MGIFRLFHGVSIPDGVQGKRVKVCLKGQTIEEASKTSAHLAEDWLWDNSIIAYAIEE